MGTNELVGTDPAKYSPFFEKLFSDTWKKGQIPPLWDGKTAERIVGHLTQLL
jgi:UDP-N-acetylglucosamine 2-epimerase (non-hydrolysing)